LIPRGPLHVTPSKAEPNYAYIPAYVLVATKVDIPPASGLLRSILEKNPLLKMGAYKYSLQLRMTLAALTGVVEVFSWIAEKKGIMQASDRASCLRFALLFFSFGRRPDDIIDSHRQSMESTIPPSMMDRTFIANHHPNPITTNETEKDKESQHPSQPLEENKLLAWYELLLFFEFFCVI
jgi:hypothetical protein